MSDDRIGLEDFRAEARRWLATNMRRKAGLPTPTDAEDRVLQAKLAEGGYAGIAFPTEYGGRGLTVQHQAVFYEEAEPYELPAGLRVSQAMIAPTLLENASPEFLANHLPKILRGEEKWIQLLSEPAAGSDLAGVLTKAIADGDRWIINGAKVWSTDATSADYGLCLARTDFDRPKHRGLTMFALPLCAPGVTVNRIAKSDGADGEFCEEFFDDVALPADAVVGEVDNGWAVAQNLLFHERNTTGGVGYGVGLHPKTKESVSVDDLIEVVRNRGTAVIARDLDLLAEAFVNSLAQDQLGERITVGYRTKELDGPWGSLLKLGAGLRNHRRAAIALDLAGTTAVVWDDGSDNGPIGSPWLNAMVVSVAGGTNEMQRNTISEKLLGLPREPNPDRDIPFRESLRRRSEADR